MARTWYNMTSAGGDAELSIYDEIGGWGVTAAQFHADLKALGDIGRITLRINSPGGSIIDGTAIYNLLKQHPAHKTVCIDGIAASMASVVAMAGDVVKMPGNALLMIHNPWTMAEGDAVELRKTADVLDKMKAQIIGAYASKSGRKDEDISAMMDADTWLSGEEAKAAGFCDEVLEPLAAAASVDLSKLANVDPRAKALIEGKANESANPVPAATQPCPVCAAGAIEAAIAQGRKQERDSIDAELSAATARITAALADVADRDAKLTAALAKIDELDAALVQARADNEAIGKQHTDFQRKHANMLAAVALVPEVTWPEALTKCGGNYSKARMTYPAAYAAFMHAKTNHGK